MPSEATCMDLEIIMLNEMLEKGKYDSTYIWSLKYDTNELAYETNRLTDIENKLNLWFVSKLNGKGRWG